MNAARVKITIALDPAYRQDMTISMLDVPLEDGEPWLPDPLPAMLTAAVDAGYEVTIAIDQTTTTRKWKP